MPWLITSCNDLTAISHIVPETAGDRGLLFKVWSIKKQEKAAKQSIFSKEQISLLYLDRVTPELLHGNLINIYILQNTLLLYFSNKFSVFLQDKQFAIDQISEVKEIYFKFYLKFWVLKRIQLEIQLSIILFSLTGIEEKNKYLQTGKIKQINRIWLIRIWNIFNLYWLQALGNGKHLKCNTHC